jgi:hypothetical protein
MLCHEPKCAASRHPIPHNDNRRLILRFLLSTFPPLGIYLLSGPTCSRMGPLDGGVIRSRNQKPKSSRRLESHPSPRAINPPTDFLVKIQGEEHKATLTGERAEWQILRDTLNLEVSGYRRDRDALLPE